MVYKSCIIHVLFQSKIAFLRGCCTPKSADISLNFSHQIVKNLGLSNEVPRHQVSNKSETTKTRIAARTRSCKDLKFHSQPLFCSSYMQTEIILFLRCMHIMPFIFDEKNLRSIPNFLRANSEVNEQVLQMLHTLFMTSGFVHFSWRSYSFLLQPWAREIFQWMN